MIDPGADPGEVRELKLSYSVNERYGRASTEIHVSNGDERVTIFHAPVNPDFKGGKDAAAWGIVVEALARLLRDDE